MMRKVKVAQSHAFSRWCFCTWNSIPVGSWSMGRTDREGQEHSANLGRQRWLPSCGKRRVLPWQGNGIKQKPLGVGPEQRGCRGSPRTRSELLLSFLLVLGFGFHALPHSIILLSSSEIGLDRTVNQRLGPLNMSAWVCAGTNPQCA